MAKVTLTHSLRSRVVNKLRELFRDRLETIEAKIVALGLEEDIRAFLTPPRKAELIRELEAEEKWVPYLGQVAVRLHSSPFPVPNAARTVDIMVTGQKTPFPMSYANAATLNYRVLELGLANITQRVLIEPLLESHAQITSEMETTTREINTLLESCVTLKQAIEKWPSVVDFLPEEVIARHREPTAAAKRTKTVIDEVAPETKSLIIKAMLLR